MPINEFQSEILTLLAKNRNPDSYIAGGIAINRSLKSIRYSKDIDIFHHAEEAVISSFEQDEKILTINGYNVTTQRKEGNFTRAYISKNNVSIKLEWVRDSAFRFFPVVKDELLGFRLHDIDLATNKCLALASRHEIRDVLDIYQIHTTYLSISANIWAASGKDPGLGPGFILNQLSRNAKIYPEDLEKEVLLKNIDIKELRMNWIEMLEKAEAILDSLPIEDLGCIYLENNKPVKNIDINKISNYQKHFGKVLGSWPQVVE